MSKKIQWGILGCGTIANEFAYDLAYTINSELVAAGSRSLEKARAFAKKYKAKRFYGSYQDLVKDNDVDVVYVATPHPFHNENTLQAVSAGKAVLCEKPAALNARQFLRMKNAAAKKGVFLMEGMWTRFFPVMCILKRWLDEKQIGDILEVKADFGFHFKVPAGHRIHNMKLGGGALLDLGIYPVSLASFVYHKQPRKIISIVHKEKSGADEQDSILFQYENGASASLSCTSRVMMKQQVCIYGTKGMILIPDNFYRPTEITLKMEGQAEKTYNFLHPGTGFQYEIDHVADCVSKGKLQSDIMSLNESLEILQTMDKIRKQWNLKYPNE
jgi:dihydrodiol dehydrogenase / D-xylose 1-dehydrogenase (NADP)